MPKTSFDFSKTKIYKIVCKDVSIPELYVGHTTKMIKRKYNHKDACCKEHKKEYNQYKYQFIRENGGWDNFEFVVIEDYPCNNVEEATRRERYWVENLNATLNKTLPSRTSKEYYETHKEDIKEQRKEYREKNHDKILEKKKEYYYANQEEQKLKSKEFRETHQEYIKEYKTKWYDENKERLSEKNKEKSKCECGMEYTKSNKSRHFKTQFHIDFICKQSQE